MTATPLPVRQAEARHAHNAAARPTLTPEVEALLTEAEHQAARREITSWPGYAPTPVVGLRGVAAAAGVAEVLYKDEAHRFGLGSFKALGGAYAVLRLLKDILAAEGHGDVSAQDLIAGRLRDRVARETVVCATDGNHGRSVAWGARMFGCACRIYIHENVSEDREAAIAAYGATMVRLPGDYDASVRAAARDAEANGWHLVADTNAGGGSDRVPNLVMQGYTLIVDELIDQLPEPPTHVFVPAGVGGLAAAIAGRWAVRAGAERPRIVVVEPLVADCVFRALRDGVPRPVEGDVNSFMACLSAGEVSPAAWPILKAVADDAVAIPDGLARETMRRLAHGAWGDAPLVSGESGCAAVAALLAAGADDALREALDLGREARVVCIGSEGATAPDLWAEATGLRPQDVTGEKTPA
ncbi:diaminopropionate ammonia-lyase [Rubellimicrobium sp. CFH 75288]|uniref:diaminopropionate ammonia-lyase n=1 Tax=Rubellimicrobium sp. CFH 75288 TaxID=2697034 RepID=UPI001412E826|nr:diaminopropionate ammonia-lyase [Rubellimicrobium sp. CFH 75288]NAZ35310.1 diaminopropionate ammonia-lyase [Rubellimicrobium sp. CFH 75288]